MKKKAFHLLLLSLSFLLSGCFPAQKIAKFDHQTGTIQVPSGKKLGSAEIIKKENTLLTHYKDFVFFSSNQYHLEYGYNQLKELGYFKQVMKHSDLEKLVIANNLQDKIINLDSQIGLSRLAKNYHPFLWVELMPYQEKNKSYLRLKVTSVENADNLFEARTLFQGGTDETVLYPLFNELSLWLKDNS